MSKIRILIADDNLRFASFVRDYLLQKDFEVLGIASDGLDTIYLIDSLKPDIVLLDIIMPKLDGFGVLERMYESKQLLNTRFIVFSAIGQDMMVQKALNLGASYFILKPFDLDVLCRRIHEVSGENFTSRNLELMSSSTEKDIKKRRNNFEALTARALRNKNIPLHMAGYQYLTTAVLYVIENPNDFLPITRKLYPVVAAKYHSTAQKVERAIRNSLDSAWKCEKGRPTNTEFIVQIVNEVKANREEE